MAGSSDKLTMVAPSALPAVGAYALSLVVVFGGWMVALFGVAGSVRPAGVQAFALLAAAGVGFVASSLILVRSRVDRLRWVAALMEDRVLRARENWASDTLRSLLEVGGWLHLTFRLYAVSQSAPLAAVCGAGAGAFCVVMGEVFTEFARELAPPPLAAQHAPLLSALLTPQAASVAAALVLAGSLWHAEESHDLGLALILAAMANVAFVTAEQLLMLWRPTRWAAEVLHDRALNMLSNWQHQTLRSGFETSFYLSSIFSLYSLTESVPLAVLGGTLAGMLVVLSSSRIGFAATPGARPEDADAQLLRGAGLVAVVFAWACATLLYTVLVFSRSALLAILVVLPTAAALVCVAALAKSQQQQTQQQQEQQQTLNAARSKQPPSKLAALRFALRALLPLPAGDGPASPMALPPVHMRAVEADEAAARAEDAAQAAQWEKQVRARVGGDALRRLRRADMVGKPWVSVDGFVADVGAFAASHPGGEALLRDYADRNADISDQFAAFHHPSVRARLLPLLVARLEPELEQPQAQDNPGQADARDVDARMGAATQQYRRLAAFLWRRGYFDGAERDAESARSVLQQHLVVLSLLVLTLCQVALLGRQLRSDAGGSEDGSAWARQLLQSVVAGASLGMFWQQVAFIAHDALHNGVVNRTREARPRSRWVPHNVLGWLHGSVCFGISAAMWLDEHSVHHALTMRPCGDAQFNYLPLWAVSVKEFATRHWQEMRSNVMFMPALTRSLVAVQHVTLLPLAVIIGRFNFYLINIGYALKHGVYCDLLGMALFWTGLCALVSQLAADAWLATAFVLAAHWTVGILHVQLLINHLGTDALFAEEEARAGWFAFQMRTTRNIDASARSEWFHGGLHFQIEHHLFPQLPRHRLALAKPAVLEICAAHGIAYESTSFFEAVRRSLASFKHIADEVWAGNLAA